jgi:hypothetical protein
MGRKSDAVQAVPLKSPLKTKADAELESTRAADL